MIHTHFFNILKKCFYYMHNLATYYRVTSHEVVNLHVLTSIPFVSVFESSRDFSLLSEMIDRILSINYIKLWILQNNNAQQKNDVIVLSISENMSLELIFSDLLKIWSTVIKCVPLTLSIRVLQCSVIEVLNLLQNILFM